MNQVESYTLTLKEKNGQTEEISGQDIDVIYKKNHALEKVKEKQNPFLWPKAFGKSLTLQQRSVSSTMRGSLTACLHLYNA